ncbi:fimbrial protein [Pseudomonas sp. RL_15y_Pfl2_60]|uniref:fimbrial protein n=1 Tax=Pseudomonas sp. RL_15y_Pfl2_60 TaxID=3088709 RepID=UPI0030DCC1F1
MKTLSAAFLGLASVGLLSASGAYAADGTITITGQVVDSSCDIAVNGATGDATVVLPSVSKTTLANPGDTAGATSVSMSLTGCPATGSVRAYFEALNVDQATGYLTNTAAATPAENVQVQVTDASGTGIDLRTNDNNNFVDFTDDAGVGTANLEYGVQYVATDAATAGQVETQLVYSLDYQ